MKNRILQFIVLLALSSTGAYAQTSCADLNNYVSYKNAADTGYYVLNAGFEEKAAQTYHYSGPGKVSSVRIYGNYPGLFGGVPLQVGVYNVDNTGRPTSLIQSVNTTWWWFNNTAGYMDVYFSGGGVMIDHNFAVEVELRSASPWGSSFRVQYTGNGEGHGENLASLAGTSTGNNWSSAMVDFSRDGDFYLVPRMTNYITSAFTASSRCIATGGNVTFTNTSTFSKDSMFNKIAFNNGAGPDFYYDWNFGDGSPVSHATSPSHVYATAGVYTVTLTSNLVGWHGSCSDVKTMQISVGLAVSATSIVNSTCNGSDNGSIVAVGTGGATPYTYNTNDYNNHSNPNFGGLGAGTYSVYVTDALGCRASAPFVITEPQAISFTSIQSTTSSCGNADGGIVVNATGGTGALQYRLNSGSYQANGNFYNQPSGSYTITVKDANNCTAQSLATVSDAGGPTLTVTSTTSVSCNGGNDGSIVLSATGGAGVLQYSINAGATYQSNGNFPGLTAAVYSVRVKDANGCSKSMLINITQPEPLTVHAEASPVLCFGNSSGKIVVTDAGGGTGSFIYSINGIMYQSYTNFAGIPAGQYIVRVKDVAGCIGRDTVIVEQPTALSATVSTTPTTCNGGYDGTISIAGSGGVGSYSYKIASTNFANSGTFSELSAGTYVLAVKDGNNCIYNTSAVVTQPSPVTATINVTTSTCGNSNGAILAIASGGSGSGYVYALNSGTVNSTGLFNNLTAGTYYVIFRDGVGCANILPSTVTDANGPVIGSVSHTNVGCHGGTDGSITVNNVTGGTGTLQYTINGTNWQTSPVFTGLSAGQFSVTVKDVNGCTGTITTTLTEPSAFVMTTSVTNLTCYGDNSGVATIYASGGSGISAYSIDYGTFQSSNTFAGLSAATHVIIARDAAGCFGYTVFDITQPAAITVLHSELNVSCNGAEDGSIELLGTGGTGAYQYSLDGTNYQNPNYFSGLSGGEYTGYIKDSSGCVQTTQVTLLEPTNLNVEATTNNISCAGGNNGAIILNVTGGTAPYTYSWTTEAYTNSLFNLTAGTYAVKVVDNNGCFINSSFTLTQPSSPLIVNGVVVNATSAGSSDGSVTLTVTGGVGSYSYNWSNGATSRDLTEVAAGTYTVNITDENGCITTGSFIVGGPTGITEIGQSGVNVVLYPNPATDVATIEVSKYTISNLKLININGELISELEPRSEKVQIRTNELASGIYFVKLLVNGNSISKKLIVNN